jgi:hypothetical protein
VAEQGAQLPRCDDVVIERRPFHGYINQSRLHGELVVKPVPVE